MDKQPWHDLNRSWKRQSRMADFTGETERCTGVVISIAQFGFWVDIGASSLALLLIADVPESVTEPGSIDIGDELDVSVAIIKGRRIRLLFNGVREKPAQESHQPVE